MGVVIPQVVTEDRASGAQIVDGGLRFDASKSQYLSRTPSSAGNRKTWTWAGWVKRSGLGARQMLFGSNSLWFELELDASDRFQIYWETSGTGTNQLFSNAVYRDTAAWMHVVMTVDTTQAAAADRIKVYVNGEQITWSSASYPSQNYDTGINSTSLH